MKKKYNFNMKSMPKAYNKSGETIIEIIGNYILITVLLVLCGLIYSDGVGRGYPLPWLQNGNISVPELGLSFALFGGIVIIADIIARIRRSGETDYRSQYRSANVIANNSSNVVINDTDDFGMNVVSVPQTSTPSKPKLPDRKSKPSGSTGKSRDFDNVPLLNSNKSSSRKASSKANPGVLLVTVLVFIVMLVFSSIIGFLSDDFDDWDDTDDSIDSVQLVADNVISDYIIWEDSALDSAVEGISEDDINALYDYADWDLKDSSDFWVIHEVLNGNEAVIKYGVEIDDEQYIIAFKVVASDEDSDIDDLDTIDDSELKITGISAVSGLNSMLDDAYDFESSSYSNEKWKEILDKVDNDCVSVGDCIIEDSPIILY